MLDIIFLIRETFTGKKAEEEKNDLMKKLNIMDYNKERESESEDEKKREWKKKQKKKLVKL